MSNHDVKTVCPYCGVGCGLIATTDGRKVLRVRGDSDHPSNLGAICRKGATVAQTIHVRTRLRHPMIRDAKETKAVVPPGRAVVEIAKRFKSILDRHGSEAIGFYLSGQLTTETQYLANKFAKGYLRTNNVDSNSRLCMASAASGMKLSFGSDGPPVCYNDLDIADTFLFIGSNAADCHPVTFERIAKRVRDGAKCVVVDPRRTATTEIATHHLRVKPGTDLTLLNGLLRFMRDHGGVDHEFIVNHTEGWTALNDMLREYTAQRVADECGIALRDFLAAAQVIGERSKLITLWTMGVNQTLNGTFTTNAIANLHLATGRIGKPGMGPFSLTGQPNAMGGRDSGYMSHTLPGYRSIENADHRRAIEKIWNLPAGTIRTKAGLDTVRLFEAMERGEVKALWIIGSNPAATMPNLPRIRRALAKCELVVLQDVYYPTETSEFAHIILPGAVNMEQTGTFCNSERRVSLMEEVIEPPGDAKADWKWVRDVAVAMGFKSFGRYTDAAVIFDEFARSTGGSPNDQSALDHDLLRSEGPQYWPFPVFGKPVERRYADYKFPTPSGKAQLFSREAFASEDRPSAEYPLLLTTGRIANHWHTRTKTQWVEQFRKDDPAPYAVMHPADARVFDLHDGQAVRIESRRGATDTILRLDPGISPGVIFMPMHWADLFAPHASPNEAVCDETDPISLQPALKHSAVRITAQVMSKLPTEQGSRAAVTNQL
ncbi:MAG: nitrate reductase [Phycisphaerae bacterium]|nr:nitrate reductase [Phycisphaerae bacterium]